MFEGETEPILGLLPVFKKKNVHINTKVFCQFKIISKPR